jgi:alpha-amylase
VYWVHYFDWGTPIQNAIKTMINIRKSKGITNTSTVSIQAADSSKYAAIITGTQGKVAMKIGYGAWAPSGTWTLATSGTNYAIWTQ